VLSGIIGPTAVLTLRTLAMVARTGSTTWHIADLAALSGVKSGIMRHTLDRLHQFGWLNMDTSDQVGVYLNGSLSQRQIARLHPTVADHYLGRSRSQTPTSTATSPVIGNHHASTGPSSQLAPRSSEETPTIDDRGTAHHIVHRWVSPPALDSSRPQPARAATPDTGPTPGAARRPELDL
jgi:hypothetical protein